MSVAWEAPAVRCLAPAAFLLGSGLAAMGAERGEVTTGQAIGCMAASLAFAGVLAFAAEKFADPGRGESSPGSAIRAAAVAAMAVACSGLGSAELWGAGVIWATRADVGEMIRSLPAEIENNRLGQVSAVSSEAYRLIQEHKVAGDRSPFAGCGWGSVRAVDGKEGPARVEFLTDTRMGIATATLVRDGCDRKHAAKVSFSAKVSVSLLGYDVTTVSVLDYGTFPMARAVPGS